MSIRVSTALIWFQSKQKSNVLIKQFDPSFMNDSIVIFFYTYLFLKIIKDYINLWSGLTNNPLGQLIII